MEHIRKWARGGSGRTKRENTTCWEILTAVGTATPVWNAGRTDKRHANHENDSAWIIDQRCAASFIRLACRLTSDDGRENTLQYTSGDKRHEDLEEGAY
jgi:hypothetical protein